MHPLPWRSMPIEKGINQVFAADGVRVSGNCSAEEARELIELANEQAPEKTPSVEEATLEPLAA